MKSPNLASVDNIQLAIEAAKIRKRIKRNEIEIKFNENKINSKPVGKAGSEG